MKIFGIGIPFTRADEAVSVRDAQNREITGRLNSEAAATAAMQFGAGLYSRAFMSAMVTPALPALNPEYLAAIARDVLTTGNHVALVAGTSSSLKIFRASRWDVQGDVDPETWQYNLTFNSPGKNGLTKNTRKLYPQSEVIHIRINAPANRPWRGQSVLDLAETSADLIANVEEGMKQEAGMKRASVLTHPMGVESDSIDVVANDIRNAEGNAVVAEGGPSDVWTRGGNPGKWNITRIGPAFNPSEVSVREQVAGDLLSAMGIPAGLFVPKQGQVSREAYRQLLASGITPLGVIIAAELSRKLGQIIQFQFHRLAAADVRTRGQAYKALLEADKLTETPMDIEDIRRIAGIYD